MSYLPPAAWRLSCRSCVSVCTSLLYILQITPGKQFSTHHKRNTRKYFHWLHILIPSLELDMCILTVTSRIKTRVATLDLILGGSKHWALIISLVHIWSDAWRPGTIPLLLIRARTCSSDFTRCYITEQQRSMLTLYSLSPGDDESFIELGT